MNWVNKVYGWAEGVGECKGDVHSAVDSFDCSGS